MSAARENEADPAGPELTQLLLLAARGDKSAEGRLFEQIQAQLHRCAGRELRRWRPGQSIGSTALVDEIYLRLFGDRAKEWPNRRFFFSAVARSMHDIMIEHYRRKERRPKREPLPDGGPPGRADGDGGIEPLALKLALEEYEEIKPRAAEAFRYRCILGLSYEEIGEELEIGHATAERDVREARGWLRRKFYGADPDDVSAS